MGTPRVAAAWLAIGHVACGLSVVGVANDSAPGPDGGLASPPSGGVVDAANPTAPDGGGGESVTCDAGVVGAGAVIVPADGEACPPDTTEATAQTSPQALSGACSCGTCTPTADPSCADPTFVWNWGGSSTCSGGGPQNFDVTANGTCLSLNGSTFSLAAYNRWSAVTPTPGACTAAAVTDATKVSSTAMRQCVPNGSAAVCAALSGGQHICVPAANGTCAGTFSHSVVVGDAATVTCGGCGCTRTASACNVEYHDNTQCTSLKLQRPADGQCDATMGTVVNSMRVVPLNPTCASAAGEATPALTNQRTLCCTQ